MCKSLLVRVLALKRTSVVVSTFRTVYILCLPSCARLQSVPYTSSECTVHLAKLQTRLTILQMEMLLFVVVDKLTFYTETIANLQVGPSRDTCVLNARHQTTMIRP